MSLLPGLRLATGLLTILPVYPPQQIERSAARDAMILAPLAVLPPAVVAAAAGFGASLAGLPSMLVGMVVVGVLTVGTRAMHLDGLADTVDGLGSARPRDEALEIMKKGDIGPMGVAAMVVVIGIQAAAAGAMIERPLGWVQVMLLICLSRAALVLGCLDGVQSARQRGLGALVADSVPLVAAVVTWVLVILAAIGSGLIVGQPWWIPLVGALVALGAAWWLLSRCVYRFGGITGDVLGALIEVCATVLLVAGAAGW